MKALVDTSVAIDCLRGNDKALQALRDARVDGASLLISVLSVAEIYAGMYPKERKSTEEFLSAFSPVGISDVVARQAGAYAFEYRDSRPRISLVDYLIAATAVDESAQLLTLNVKDFPMITTLSRPY